MDKFNNIKKIVMMLMFVCVLTLLLLCVNKQISIKQNNEHKTKYSDDGFKKNIEDNCSTFLTDEDFCVKNVNTYIKLDDVFDETKINDKLIYYRPENENHPYESYRYENYTLWVSLDDIFSITVFESELETNRGVKVGDSVSKLFEKYGQTSFNKYDTISDYDGSTGFYSYHYNRKSLFFYVDQNDKIVKIKLEDL